ncbi:hypothetical protein [Streptomyces sp. NPDC057694]|uniref:hypothetical protein n=1 Tax=Streptomyces sp. NPDC057694 TaxID=3346216 RepID=UPI0036CD8A50
MEVVRLTEPVYLARRADGQMIRLSYLLYLTASEIDGRSDGEAIAERVGREFGKEDSADNIRFLVEHKLQPLGVTAPPDAVSAALPADAPRSDLLLGLMGRRTLVPAPAVRAAARVLAPVHRPLVVAAVLLAAAAMDGWLFLVHGAVPALLTALDEPLPLLGVFGLVVASLVFHEFGHASACRYAGATPGRIGCALYLAWPSLYTDVTDVYRAGRAGRLRTDLGGVYFNVVFMLGLVGLYGATGWNFLLAAVYLGHFEIFEQLMPAARLDGYYILADVAGVPDLYGQIGPVLRGLLPRRRKAHGAAGALALTRGARTLIGLWALVLVPLVVTDLGYSLWNLPRIAATATRSLTAQYAAAVAAASGGHPAACAVPAIGLFLLLLPLVGIAVLLARVLRRLGRVALTATARRRPLRVAVCSIALAGVISTGSGWLAGRTPEPLPPHTSAPLFGHAVRVRHATQTAHRRPVPHAPPVTRGPSPAPREVPAPRPARVARHTPHPKTPTASPHRPAGRPAPRVSASASGAPAPGASPSVSDAPSPSRSATASPGLSPTGRGSGPPSAGS